MLILILATVISMVVGDLADGVIIIVIIVASGLLGFFQERRANSEVAALLKTVQVTVPVRRDGREILVPVVDVVPGDIVILRAGGVVPADCRLLDSESLLVDESTLTGESFPVEKDANATVAVGSPIGRRINCLFLGTHVVSGTGIAVAVDTGSRTEFGAVSADLEKKRVTTAFTRGTTRFGVFLVWVMSILTAFVFLVNILFGRPLIEALLFALALAVGLSPQMLPAITSVSLSAGARRMARRKVIVKRLDAIEDFGSMTVLCTDKTGTLTEGAALLDRALDLDGVECAEILELASLNAGLQHGFVNPLDAVILDRLRPPADAVALDELPYDFTRRRLSVLVTRRGTPTVISKGAFNSIVSCCDHAVVGGEVVMLETAITGIQARFASLSDEGFRVLGIATRTLSDGAATLALGDESGMTLVGVLAFRDPARPDATEAIAKLEQAGVSVRLLTGDNRLAAAAIARRVGLDAGIVLTGSDIEAMNEQELVHAVPGVCVFAELEPLHKRRIVLAFRSNRHTVGFLGDGINDAPALHASDVGISVATAVDVAKQAAGVVLLDKSLSVILDGVVLGRETFANTLKYVRVTTSASFGNMFSMAIASLFLPFLPLLPRQILLLNFLSDIPATTIASDRVEPERLTEPGRWDLRGIRNFMLIFGLLSTVFDMATFAVLIWGFGADDVMFRSAWFIESTLTEVVVLLSLRTSRPIFLSRPGRGLLWSSIAVVIVTVALPYIPPVAGLLGLDAVHVPVVLALFGLTAVYLAANELLKRRFLGATPVQLPRASGSR